MLNRKTNVVYCTALLIALSMLYLYVNHPTIQIENTINITRQPVTTNKPITHDKQIQDIVDKPLPKPESNLIEWRDGKPYELELEPVENSRKVIYRDLD